MPLVGTYGWGGCLDAAAKIGSRGWAPRLTKCSALRSPVENSTMDWLKEDLISNMADIEKEEQEKEMRRVESLN